MSAVLSRGYLADVDGVHGRVRATFDRCAYVTVDGGPALVLHGAGRDHTPTSLCPVTWPPMASPVAVGDPVVGRAGHLRIGDLVLDVRGARVWRPAPPPVWNGGLADADAGAGHRLALCAARRRTGDLLPALMRALAGLDEGRVRRCVASITGLGPGLTPSGDDALVGLLAVLHRLAPQGEGSLAARRLGRAVVENLHRTADISAHYLRLAAAGHFGERLIALCDALAGGAPSEVGAAAEAVVATGATSGADALLGVVSGLRWVATVRAAATPGADALLGVVSGPPWVATVRAAATPGADALLGVVSGPPWVATVRAAPVAA
jgi:hypothetical protein